MASLLMGDPFEMGMSKESSWEETTATISWSVVFSAGRMDGGSRRWRRSSDEEDAVDKNNIRLQRKTPEGADVRFEE